MVGQLLDVRGRVLPMSLTPLDISAQVVGLDPNRPDEEYTLTGQATIAKTRAEVLKVGLEPSEPDACPQALEAIRASDNLVILSLKQNLRCRRYSLGRSRESPYQ